MCDLIENFLRETPFEVQQKIDYMEKDEVDDLLNMTCFYEHDSISLTDKRSPLKNIIGV